MLPIHWYLNSRRHGTVAFGAPQLLSYEYEASGTTTIVAEINKIKEKSPRVFLS